MKREYTPFDPANRTARWLIEIGAVEFSPDNPFTWTSGRKSPIYVDVRKVLGVARARAEITAMACARIYDQIGATNIQFVAGGETAGIPFAVMVAERMGKPMCYVRKQPKGFGRNAQIEGLTDDQLSAGKKFLLVEDLCSDGGSKRVFIEAIRRSGNIVIGVFTVFSYGCFDATRTLADDGVPLYSLLDGFNLIDVADDLDWATAAQRREIRRFLSAPSAWQSAVMECV
jgi:orotate phosphoribosyltransferase